MPAQAVLGDVVTESLARWGVPGAVVGTLVDGRSEIEAFGIADLRTREPVRAEQTFRIASITKPFTATLALVLADDGLVDLDETVPLPLPAEGITIRQLLAHLGGFEGEMGDLSRFGDRDDALPRAAAELCHQRQIVQPGRAWSYCNAGYWAVGAVCAARLGTTYEEALRGHVLEPLALASTSFAESDVVGHLQPQPGLPAHEPAPPSPYPRARRPSGGLRSTASDLLRFAATQLADERLLPLRAGLAERPGGAYGLGLALESVGGLEVWGHDGAYGGFRSRLALVPERRAALALLVNGDAGDAVVREATDAFLQAACGVARSLPPTVETRPGDLAAVAGRYADASVEADVAVASRGLLVDVVATSPADGKRTVLPRLRARPVGGRTFALAGGQWDGELFDFVPVSGRVEFVRLDGRLVARR